MNRDRSVSLKPRIASLARCPNCGKHVVPDRDGCPNCGYPEEPTPREPFFRARDNERDMELYDDLFDAHAKLAEHGFIDRP